MPRFEEQKVWQQAHALVTEIDALTEQLPADKGYGMRSQLLRAAVSLLSNLGEASLRKNQPQHVRFLNLAESSVAETEHCLKLSRDLGYLSGETIEPFLAKLAEVALRLQALRPA